MTTWVFFTNSKETNDAYRFQPDRKKEWGAQVQVHTTHSASKKSLYTVQFDDNPKSYFLLPHVKATDGRTEVQYRTLEGDREAELILQEKIHLYTPSQTITIKGDESWWGDYCIQQGVINAGTLGQKGTLMEVKHPPIIPGQQAFMHLWKFLTVVRSDNGLSIRAVMPNQRCIFETNNDTMRAMYYVKLLAQHDCFLKPENDTKPI